MPLINNTRKMKRKKHEKKTKKKSKNIQKKRIRKQKGAGPKHSKETKPKEDTKKISDELDGLQYSDEGEYSEEESEEEESEEEESEEETKEESGKKSISYFDKRIREMTWENLFESGNIDGSILYFIKAMENIEALLNILNNDSIIPNNYKKKSKVLEELLKKIYSDFEIIMKERGGTLPPEQATKLVEVLKKHRELEEKIKEGLERKKNLFDDITDDEEETKQPRTPPPSQTQNDSSLSDDNDGSLSDDNDDILSDDSLGYEEPKPPTLPSQQTQISSNSNTANIFPEYFDNDSSDEKGKEPQPYVRDNSSSEEEDKKQLSQYKKDDSSEEDDSFSDDNDDSLSDINTRKLTLSSSSEDSEDELSSSEEDRKNNKKCNCEICRKGWIYDSNKKTINGKTINQIKQRNEKEVGSSLYWIHKDGFSTNEIKRLNRLNKNKNRGPTKLLQEAIKRRKKVRRTPPKPSSSEDSEDSEDDKDDIQSSSSSSSTSSSSSLRGQPQGEPLPGGPQGGPQGGPPKRTIAPDTINCKLRTCVKITEEDGRCCAKLNGRCDDTYSGGRKSRRKSKRNLRKSRKNQS